MATRSSPSRRSAIDRVTYLATLCRTVPYNIVEAVLANPVEASIPTRDRFEGTVLYADLVGFTSTCEGMARSGPEGLSRLTTALNVLFARLLEDAVFPYDGYVVQFGGDSLTAIFRRDGHAARAGAAALCAQGLMRDELGRLLDEDQRSLFLRVGMASGPVRFVVVGDAAQRAVASAGAAAHRALAMQRLAEPGQVVVDGAYMKALGPGGRALPLPDGNAVLEEIPQWPERATIHLLDGRVEDKVEEKIALLEPFVPPPLAARLQTTPLGWRVEGELRDVVVLFAEIAGLDEAGADTDLALQMSRSFLRAFRKYGGIGAKVDLADVGHRAMVLFGLHHPSDNDCERALLASLETVARLRGLAVGRDKLMIKIGAHVGPVYFGAFGSDYRHDITVVGDTVNTAARAASAAQPFEVVATDAVLEKVRGEFHASTRAGLAVKGKSAPLELGVIHGPAARSAHYVRRRAQRRFFAGRDDAIQVLKERVQSGIGGSGSAVGLVGEPGTGKSALLSYVIDEWAERGGLGLLARCRLATRAEPLAPIIAAFSSFLGLAPGDDEEARGARVRAGLGPYRLADGADELVALLQPVRRPDGTSEALVDLADPHARERVLGAILGFIAARVRQEPVLYVVEDAHHADALTLDLMSRVASLVKDGRHLFVITYRPDPVVAPLRRALATEIALATLDDPGIDALVQHEMKAGHVDPGLRAFLASRTGGNPGHLVEILRYMKDRSLVTVRGGTVVAPIGEDGFLDAVVPQTLAHVALARLDELGEVERRILRTASAIGQRIPRDVMERVASDDVDATMLYAAMANLESDRVLFQEATERGGWSFKDDVTRAVAYGTIPESRRKEVHRRIADALELLDEREPARTPAALAIHRERAGQPLQAAVWYERAARIALAAGLDEEASRLVERWERVVAELPAPDRPDDGTQARMALAKLVALGRTGVPADCVRQGRVVVGEHWPHLDEEGRRVADRWLGEALLWMGQLQKGRERLERVHATATEPSLRCDAATLVARAHELSGDRATALAWLERAAVDAEGDADRAARVSLHRAHLVVAADELAAALTTYADVEAHAARRRHARLQAAAKNGAAHARMHLMRFDEAAAGFEEARALFHAVGAWSDVANALVNLGQARLWAGRYDDARRDLEAAASLAAETRDEMAALEAKVHLGAARALTQDVADGLRLLEEGAAEASRVGWHEPRVAAALHGLHVAVVAGDVAAARRHDADVAALLASGATPLFAHVHAALRARLSRLDAAAAD